MTYKSPSGVFNYTQVPDDAGNADIHVYVNDEEVTAGGGSSDFTTCQMTIDENFSDGCLIYAPFVINNIDGGILSVFNASDEAIPAGTYPIALYKGKTMVYCAESSFNVSGNAEADNEYIIVTGDFTLSPGDIS